MDTVSRDDATGAGAGLDLNESATANAARTRTAPTMSRLDIEPRCTLRRYAHRVRSFIDDARPGKARSGARDSRPAGHRPVAHVRARDRGDARPVHGSDRRHE